MTASQIMDENKRRQEEANRESEADGIGGGSITVDFSDYPEIRGAIEQEARKDIRTPSMQIVYYLTKRVKPEPEPGVPSVPSKECPVCGEQFQITRKDRIYCSRTCKLKAYKTEGDKDENVNS